MIPHPLQTRAEARTRKLACLRARTTVNLTLACVSLRKSLLFGAPTPVVRVNQKSVNI